MYIDQRTPSEENRDDLIESISKYLRTKSTRFIEEVALALKCTASNNDSDRVATELFESVWGYHVSSDDSRDS